LLNKKDLRHSTFRIYFIFVTCKYIEIENAYFLGKRNESDDKKATNLK